jgi:Protein of unknown function DUF88.
MSSGTTRHNTIVYIDGYNLYHGLRDGYGRKYLWLDLTRFALSLLSDPRQQLVRTKYFTSSAPTGPSIQRQQTYWKALETCPMLDVVKGQFREETHALPRLWGRGSQMSGVWCETAISKREAD